MSFNRHEGFPSADDWEELQVEWDSGAGNPLGLPRPELTSPAQTTEPDYDVLLEG